MHLDSAYRWARGVEDARIGLAGTSAGFAGYGFYGTDLSNRVRYLGEEGPHGAFNAIPTCAAFRAAVNAADLDYLVTAPFLNFLHPGDPIPSPEAAGCAARPPCARSSAAARSPSGGWTVSWTLPLRPRERTPAGPPEHPRSRLRGLAGYPLCRGPSGAGSGGSTGGVTRRITQPVPEP